jgi:hypothetical protein
MKKFFFLSLFIAALSSCDDKAGGDHDRDADSSSAKTSGDGAAPYTAAYSSDFEMGKDKHARIVLDLWKAYDDNAFERVLKHFADTVTVITADGMAMHGPKDSILMMTAEYRSGFSQVNTTVDAWIPTRAKDKDQNWVAIWGTEVHTDKKGVTDSARVHELWMFDKNDKISYMSQYTGALPKE